MTVTSVAVFIGVLEPSYAFFFTISRLIYCSLAVLLITSIYFCSPFFSPMRLFPTFSSTETILASG